MFSKVMLRTIIYKHKQPAWEWHSPAQASFQLWYTSRIWSSQNWIAILLLYSSLPIFFVHKFNLLLTDNFYSRDGSKSQRSSCCHPWGRDWDTWQYQNWSIFWRLDDDDDHILAAIFRRPRWLPYLSGHLNADIFPTPGPSEECSAAANEKKSN